MAVIGESAKKINRTFYSDGGENEMILPLKGVEVQDPFFNLKFKLSENT